MPEKKRLQPCRGHGFSLFFSGISPIFFFCSIFFKPKHVRFSVLVTRLQRFFARRGYLADYCSPGYVSTPLTGVSFAVASNPGEWRATIFSKQALRHTSVAAHKHYLRTGSVSEFNKYRALGLFQNCNN